MFDGWNTGDWQLAALVAILVIVVGIAALLAFDVRRERGAPAEGERSGTPVNPLVRLLHAEPALVAGVVSAAAALGAAFGMDLSSEQVGAIVAFISLVLSIAVRQSVYSPSTVSASGLAYDESDGTLKRRVR